MIDKEKRKWKKKKKMSHPIRSLVFFFFTVWQLETTMEVDLALREILHVSRSERELHWVAVDDEGGGIHRGWWWWGHSYSGISVVVFFSMSARPKGTNTLQDRERKWYSEWLLSVESSVMSELDLVGLVRVGLELWLCDVKFCINSVGHLTWWVPRVA